MSGPTVEPDESPLPPLAVRAYTLAALAALLVASLALTARGFGEWVLMPLLLGAVGVALRWSITPLLVFGLTAVLFAAVDRWQARFFMTLDPVLDTVLAAALLAFAACHFRLQALTRTLFPSDTRTLSVPREKGKRPVRLRPHRRPAEAVGAGELPALLLTLPLWVGLAVLLWAPLVTEESPYRRQWPTPVWHGLVLLWLAASLLLPATALLGYLRRARATGEESLLFLQDQLWRETRGDQGRANRWLVWARLRAQRRKEG